LSGAAAVFDGVDDFLTVPSFPFGGAISVSAWVKFSQFPVGGVGWERIVDFGDGAPMDNILLARDGTTTTLQWCIVHGIEFRCLGVANFWELNVWTHVAATAEGTTMKVYKDGVLAGTITDGWEPTTMSRTKQYIGRSNWANNAYFAGQIKDVGFHGAALGAKHWSAYVAGSSCVECLVSTYQPAPASTSCLDCPAGQFTDSTGSALMADCTPIGSWTELQSKIWSTITLDWGFSGTITLAETFNCNYNSQIIIRGDVTIHANGAICNAQQGGRFFYVHYGATLTLDGMTLKNAGSEQSVSVFTLCFCGWPFLTLLQHTPSCNTSTSLTPPCAMLLQTLLQHHVENSTGTREGPSTVKEHSTSMAAPLRATLALG
jgi:hypothetical protein